MNIFVASWFFPPATSSEGIVTYKLLRNSRNHYDVFSSTSKQWGYKADMQQHNEPNITCYSIETDDIDAWVEGSIAKFEELYPQQKYPCIMTRSTPPESILIGLRIKEKYPDVQWIASLADPVANNPYELKAYVDECSTLNDRQKDQLKAALLSSREEDLIPWEKRPEPGVQLLCKLKRWENEVIKKADLIISPSATQLRYMIQQRTWGPKYFALPHCFDASFYPKQEETRESGSKVVFSFIGYSDSIRSVEPFIRAVRLLKENSSPYLKKLDMRFIGNYPRSIQDLVLNYFLDDVIHFQRGVDYYHSLQLMQESDWLLHVDAFFPQIETGGSVFFAGKLADYMGADRPIFALTGVNSPAYNLVQKAGGVCVVPEKTVEIANKFEEILSGCGEIRLNESYISRFSAENVAREFDDRVDELFDLGFHIQNTDWTLPEQEKNDAGKKLVTICVPAYNVERYLERCLKTLVRHRYAEYTEILVIDDGSKDHTAQIGKRYEQQYPGIVRLISKPNGGHGSTINRAIQEGAGRYFMVVDGDDWIDSREFEKLLADIESKKIGTDIISSNYHEIDMETGTLTPRAPQTEVEYFKKLTFEELDLKKVYFTLASSLIRLDVLRSVDRPLQEHTFYVDVEYILFPVPYLRTVTFVDYWIYKYCRGNEEQSVYLPTMIARYDHHERVMKSVLSYENECAMTDAQRQYYEAILKRLLYTHYALCFVYDSDKKRGYARAKDFDRFLKETHPDLARWIGVEMKELRIARRYHFDYSRVKKSVAYFLYRKTAGWKSGVLHGAVLRRLAYNGLTLRIFQLPVFRSGIGRRIKEKIKQILN